jgi:succinate dehydrogenase flavin-adding protein (antitoxin of CptAB toxin-antitoxin module)
MKYIAIGLIFCFFLVNGTIGEEISVNVLENQSFQLNETETIEKLIENKDWKRIAELMNQEKTPVGAQTSTIQSETIEELMKNRDWKRIAELMNQEKAPVKAQTNAIQSSIQPAASNEEWNKWFAQKEEEFIIYSCGR